MAEWFMEGALPVSVNAEVLVLQSSLYFAICLSANVLFGLLVALSLVQRTLSMHVMLDIHAWCYCKKP